MRNIGIKAIRIRRCPLGGDFADTYTVSFFGHRRIYDALTIEERLDEIIRDLLQSKEYVEFLVGRNGDFDQLVSSAVRRAKKECGDHNSALVLVLPYLTGEYRYNEKSFESYYDEIEICDAAAKAHPKAAIQIRNCSMIDRSDLVVCFVEKNEGGAFRSMRYAECNHKPLLNLASRLPR